MCPLMHQICLGAEVMACNLRCHIADDEVALPWDLPARGQSREQASEE